MLESRTLLQLTLPFQMKSLLNFDLFSSGPAVDTSQLVWVSERFWGWDSFVTGWDFDQMVSQILLCWRMEWIYWTVFNICFCFFLFFFSSERYEFTLMPCGIFYPLCLILPGELSSWVILVLWMTKNKILSTRILASFFFSTFRSLCFKFHSFERRKWPELSLQI